MSPRIKKIQSFLCQKTPGPGFALGKLFGDLHIYTSPTLKKKQSSPTLLKKKEEKRSILTNITY